MHTTSKELIRLQANKIYTINRKPELEFLRQFTGAGFLNVGGRVCCLHMVAGVVLDCGFGPQENED